jgi:mono/diheme cytochrome c family protein
MREFRVGLTGAGVARRGERGRVAGGPGGHNLYEQHCQLCHGMHGLGDGPFAGELRIAPADLTTIALRRKGVFPEVEVREIIDGRRRVRGHGPDNMPIWGRVFGRNAEAGAELEQVTRDRVQSLVEYLKSIQKAAPEAPAKP